MDIVLGVSMAPSTVRMVLVEGENADGVTVDQDDFELDPADAATLASGAPDQVIKAILGTREGAQEGGYHLTSTGVTFSDQAQAAVLRDALASHKVENVMLVSAFLAAAALAQAVGNDTHYARTGLLFVEPDTATLAVIESADGSIVEVERRALSYDDDTALTEMVGLVAGAAGLPSRPDGLFVVGSGVNVAMLKPALEAAAALPVSVPEEPETALARGAALASAHAPLFSSSTQALAWAQDPGTGAVDPNLISLGYAYAPAGPIDYEATQGEGALAYSALRDQTDSVYLPVADETALADEPEWVDSSLLNVNVADTQSGSRPFLMVGSALATLFVVGVAALVITLAISIRPTASQRPEPGQNIVVPTQQAPPAPPEAAQPPPPPPPSAPPAPPVETIPQPVPAAHEAPPAAPAPAPEAPAPAAVAPVPAAPAPVPEAPAPAAPAPVPAAPAPIPEAPAPAPAAPAPVPIPIPIPIQIPAPAPAPAPKPSVPAAPKPQQPFPGVQIPGLPGFEPPHQGSPPSGGRPGGGGHDGGNNGGFPGLPGGGHDNGGIPGLPGGGGHDNGGGIPGLPGGGGHNGGWPGLGGGGHNNGGGFPGFGGGGHGGFGGFGGGHGGGGHGGGFHF